MRRFPIPEYDDVKWVPEGIIWNRIDGGGYITRFVSTPFSMTSEHAQGSMLDTVANKKSTSNKLIKYYTAYHYLSEFLSWLSLKEKMRYSVLYLAIGRITNKHKSYREAIKRMPKASKIYLVLASPVACIYENKNK